MGNGKGGDEGAGEGEKGKVGLICKMKSNFLRKKEKIERNRTKIPKAFRRVLSILKKA